VQQLTIINIWPLVRPCWCRTRCNPRTPSWRSRSKLWNIRNLRFAWSKLYSEGLPEVSRSPEPTSSFALSMLSRFGSRLLKKVKIKLFILLVENWQKILRIIRFIFQILPNQFIFQSHCLQLRWMITIRWMQKKTKIGKCI
jgi:hypothetical protein